MTKISIKKKLLIYSFLIQGIILIVFSFSLYKSVELLGLDKIKTTLKIITLDVVDDIFENKGNLNKKQFDEEKEYEFKPLYIRLLKIENTIETIRTTKFPLSLTNELLNLESLQTDVISFEIKKPFIISKIKIIIHSKEYVLEIATNYINKNSILSNLLYILFFIVPIILILSTIGGYFLIHKSFLPIEKILKNLRKINSNDLSKRLEVFNTDEDEISLLTKEINSLLTRLEISFDKISQFSSDASHELKTPLTIMRGEIEIALRKDRSVIEYKETLSNSLNEVLIIQQTTDDLLFLAKNKEHFQQLNEKIRVDDLCSEVIKEMNPYAILKSVSITQTIKDIAMIQGESKLLKIAIKNILKNAISFSQKDSEVKLCSYSKDGFVYLSIEDKGIGIPGNEQKKIFEEFYRTDKSRNKDSGGTGLGMSICKKIVDIHKSELLLYSKENSGTIVTFKFKKYTKGMENI